MLSKIKIKSLIFEIIVFVVGLAIICLFYENNILTFVLLLLGFIGVITLHPKKHDLLFFFFAFVIGPIGEIVAIHFGVWTYANPSFLGIPIWLPLVWGLAFICIKRFIQIFEKIK